MDRSTFAPGFPMAPCVGPPDRTAGMGWVVLLAAVVIAGCAATTGSSTTPPPTPSPSMTPASAAPVGAEYLGPWRASPLPVDADLAARVEDACRIAVGSSPQPVPADLGSFDLTLVDARGGGVLHAFWEGGGGQIGTCDLRLEMDGGLSASASVWAHPAGPVVAPTGIWAWSGWSEASNPGEPAPASGLGGSAGTTIASLVLKTPGHQEVVPSLASGVWTVWVPWDLNVTHGTLIGFDASGSQVASKAVP